MSSESFHLGTDIICPEAYKDVVQELGSDGSELLAAVQEDETVFVSEPPEYQEDQKNFMTQWNGVQQYEYNEASVMYPPPPLQQPLAQIPANVDYAGDLDFDILISSHTANRNSWIYSSILKKVFINMQNVLPVDVKRNPASIDLYLRATLLYSLPQYTQEIVERCSTHVDPRISTNRDVEPMVVKHVLRCSNQGSVYFGNTEMKEHLSVVTPLGLPQAGVDTVRVNYQFMCKNSCPSGMNRRAVDVIFTLEDRCGNVLGRRKLAVRVCSCPKRDKEKEEKEFKETNQQSPAYTRKRKISALKSRYENVASSSCDEALYEIPSFKILGRQTAEMLLRVGRDRMFFELTNGVLDESKQEKTRECIEEINNIIRNLTPKED